MNVILVPVDFSEVTAATLQAAEPIARRCGSKIYLVHVEHLFADELKNASVPEPHRNFLVATAHRDHQTLQNLAKDLKQRGCDVESLLVRGDVVDKILDEIRRLRANLVIMGSHGHGRLYEALVGSTCAGVLHTADIPVLVVPARGTQFASLTETRHRPAS